MNLPRWVAAVVTVLALSGCAAVTTPTPLPSFPVTSTTPPPAPALAPSPTPPPTTTARVTTSTTKAKASAKAKAKATTTKKRPKLTCEPEADARLVGDQIVNKACPANPAKEKADKAFASCPDSWNIDKQRCMTKAEINKRVGEINAEIERSAEPARKAAGCPKDRWDPIEYLCYP